MFYGYSLSNLRENICYTVVRSGIQEVVVSDIFRVFTIPSQTFKTVSTLYPQASPPPPPLYFSLLLIKLKKSPDRIALSVFYV